MIKKIQIFLFFLITLVPSICYGWTYTFDFENGTSIGVAADQTIGSGRFDAVVTSTGSITFDTVANSGYVKNGTYSAKCFFDDDSADENYSTRAHFYFPNTVAEGAEIWGGVWVRFGQAGDNPSGQDWSWSRQDTSNANVQKMFRIIKRQSDGTPKGMNSIFTQSSAEPYLSLEFAEGRSDQDSPAVALNSGQWHYLEFYFLFSSNSSTGRAKLWIDGVQKINHVKQTMFSSVTKLNDGWFWSTWNGTVPQDQNCWIDDVYISSDARSPVYTGGGGGEDTTDPVIENPSPADEATGVNKDTTVFTIELNDTETGVDTSTFQMMFNDVNVTDQLGFSGNLSNSVAYLTLSGLGLSNSTGYIWEAGSLEDVAGNIVDATVSGSLTTSGSVAANVFHTGDMGDLSNYLTRGNVIALDESGDIVVSINATDRDYAIYDSTSYLEWSIAGAYRSDSYNEEAYADMDIIFDYVDDSNYKQVTLSKDTVDSGIWERVNGDFSQIYSLGSALLVDESEHTFTLSYNNGVLKLITDSTERFSRENITVGNNKLGFGILDNNGIFDAIVITDLAGGSASSNADANVDGDGSFTGNGLLT